MGYSTVEVECQTLLRTLDQFSDADVTRGDFRVLDSGRAPYAVLYPGPFEVREYGDWGQKIVLWTVYCEIFERYLDDGTSYTSLETTRQNVVDLFGKYPSLNSTANVIYTIVSRGEDLRYLYDEAGGGPHFIMQRLHITVHEIVGYAGAGEFA